VFAICAALVVTDTSYFTMSRMRAHDHQASWSRAASAGASGTAPRAVVGPPPGRPDETHVTGSGRGRSGAMPMMHTTMSRWPAWRAEED
jgi:hypothetical protein